MEALIKLYILEEYVIPALIYLVIFVSIILMLNGGKKKHDKEVNEK